MPLKVPISSKDLISFRKIGLRLWFWSHKFQIISINSKFRLIQFTGELILTTENLYLITKQISIEAKIQRYQVSSNRKKHTWLTDWRWGEKRRKLLYIWWSSGNRNRGQETHHSRILWCMLIKWERFEQPCIFEFRWLVFWIRTWSIKHAQILKNMKKK